MLIPSWTYCRQVILKSYCTALQFIVCINNIPFPAGFIMESVKLKNIVRVFTTAKYQFKHRWPHKWPTITLFQLLLFWPTSSTIYIFFAVSAVCNVHPFVRQQRVHRSMTQCSPPAYWWSECCSTDLSAVVESKRRKSGNFCWWRSLGEFRATQIKSVEGEQYGRVSVWGWTARQA